MIESLYVRGMGGISEAELDFKGEFIVITGESGAGKSSLVRAFEFISGNRAQVAYINSANDEVVTVARWSAQREGEQLLTERALSRAGKGKCAIQGKPVTASELARESAEMIEIQSQFAQLNLLDPGRQLDLVDQCGGEELAVAKRELADLFPEMLAVEREIIELSKKRERLEADLEGASRRVSKIKSLDIHSGSEAELSEELAAVEKQLLDADRFAGLVSRISGDENEDSFLSQMELLLRDLYSVAPDGLKARWQELGEDALSSMQEIFSQAAREMGMVPKDELAERLDQLESKLGALRKLKRETGLFAENELLDYIKDVESEMAWLRESNNILAAKKARALELKTAVTVAAKKLRTLRENAAAEFEVRVRRHLNGLAMEDVRFSVDVIKRDVLRAGGAEAVSFMLAVKDLPPNPVSKVASGGELSRILIAIQASIDPAKLPETLIFDEVEAGLGGRTALLAGRKLKEISSNCRAILITHEATIAAMADQHFVVTRDGDTTNVREIGGTAREHEIARMLSGSDSEEALTHARALLKERTAESA